MSINITCWFAVGLYCLLVIILSPGQLRPDPQLSDYMIWTMVTSIASAAPVMVRRLAGPNFMLRWTEKLPGRAGTWCRATILLVLLLAPLGCGAAALVYTGQQSPHSLVAKVFIWISGLLLIFGIEFLSALADWVLIPEMKKSNGF